ncbi:MAG: amidohydrolase family protein [Anaerolineaceae bacterium]|jgi:imidazolonepropionase-like amidohydrolase
MLYIYCGQLADGTSQPISQKQALIISDGRILRIENIDQVKPSDGDTLLDLSNYTVTPGFIDCHDHVSIDIGDDAAQCAQSDARLSIIAVTNVMKMLTCGITTMRGCGEKSYLDIEIKNAIEEGLIKGPRILTSGHPICRTGGHGYSLSREADGEDDVRKAVREQLKQGVDLIKIMASGGMSTKGSQPYSQELTDVEIQAAIDEAHRAGRKVAAHLHGGSAVKGAIAASVDSIEHGALLTEEDLKVIAESDTFLVSTAGLMQVILADPAVPEFYYQKIQRYVSRSHEILSQARALGVKLAVGTDTNHGRIDLEIQALIRVGFSPIEALSIATKNGAILCGLDKDLGTLEPGKIADLLAFVNDPLEDPVQFERPILVMKNGVIEIDHRRTVS